MIRELPIWRLMHRFQTREKEPDFGFHAASAAEVSDLPALAGLVERSETLGDLLSDFCGGVRGRNPVAQFSLERRAAHTIFRRAGRRVTLGKSVMEQYALSWMLKLCRLALGPGWVPNRVWLQRSRPLRSVEAAWLPGAAVKLSAPFTGIALPTSLLSRSIRPKGPSLSRGERRVRRACRTILKSGTSPTLDEVAGMMSTSRRTLQRELASLGTSFRRVVVEV